MSGGGLAPLPAPELDRVVADGLEHHRAGRLAEAETRYRQALAHDGGHAEALHSLGVLALQVQKPEAAVTLLTRAIRTEPANPLAYGNLGVALRRLARFDQAVRAYRRAIALDPDQAEAWNNLANLLIERRRFEAARPVVDRLAATLRAHGVTMVIDVRELPLSRRAGFSKRMLASTLAEAGIGYTHLKALGTPKAGRVAAHAGDYPRFWAIVEEQLRSPPAELALRQAADLARRQPSALLCVEADPRQCHRARVAQRLAEEFGLTIEHLHPTALSLPGAAGPG